MLHMSSQIFFTIALTNIYSTHFTDEDNEGLEILDRLSRVTKVVRGRARMRTHL